MQNPSLFSPFSTSTRLPFFTLTLTLTFTLTSSLYTIYTFYTAEHSPSSLPCIQCIPWFKPLRPLRSLRLPSTQLPSPLSIFRVFSVFRGSRFPDPPSTGTVQLRPRLRPLLGSCAGYNPPAFASPPQTPSAHLI